ncbi:MAG: hypothetical protein MJB14_23355, partial [Spirochaetes bacterium]|nr:hypothetical protein [Spirochaetota bacterium]
FNISLFILGGSYRPEAGSFIGPLAMDALKKFQISTCFIGTSGISADGVFSSQNTIEAMQKKAVIEASARSIVLSDSGKIGVAAFSIFAHSTDIDILIIDDNPKKANLLQKLDIEIVKIRGD